MLTGDFNCRNSNWYLGDLVTPHEARIKALTNFYGFYQLIKTPLHLLQNSATRINLAFTNQLHLLMGSGAHNSLISTCQRGIVFTKLKNEYPLPYERIIWDCSRSDKASKNWAINAID